jgi:MYXO-CTERM domain-containing protein
MKRTMWLLGSVSLAMVSVHCAKGEAPAPEGAVGLDSMGTLAPAARAIPVANTGVEIAASGGSYVARFQPGVLAAVRTELPGLASRPFRLTSGKDAAKAIRVTPVGASEAPAHIEDGLVHYANAFGPGTDMMQKVGVDGTEDFVRFAAAPAKPDLAYQVALEAGIAGLRQIDDSIEFIDGAGSPRLRIETPYGVDANGKEFPAHLSVEGCQVDRDPRAPWGRAVTAPGARTCTVHVSWAKDVAYPATVDPAWKATSVLSNGNATHEAFLVALSGGKALASGNGTAFQVFDPATGMWANTGASPLFFNHRGRLVGIDGDKALGVPGFISNDFKTVAYSLATGLWTTRAVPPVAFNAPNGDGGALVHLGGDKVAFFSSNGTVYSYDFATDAYTAKTARASFAGGTNMGAFYVSATKIGVHVHSSTALQIYDVAANTWGAASPGFLGFDMNCANGEALSNGDVLMFGGGASANGASRWNIALGTITPIAMTNASPLYYQCHHNASVAFGKKHLIGGGRYMYDEVTATITDLGAFPSGAPTHGAIVKLKDGRALAALGNDAARNSLSDVYGASAQADCDTASDLATANTPVFDNVSKTCKACDGDNGDATPFKCPTAANPVCQPAAALAGSCTQCYTGKTALCTGTTPTCDIAVGNCAKCNGGFGDAAATQACLTGAAPVCLADGSCVIANGDKGAAGATAPCPTAENPFVKADGSCGKCANNAECAGAMHAGAICAVATGTCGNVCTLDTDCAAASFCDLAAQPTAACAPKKAAGATCAKPAECTSASCTATKCDKACTSPADCGPGTFCDLAGAPKVCKALKADGATCADKSECVNGACNATKCGSPIAPPIDAGTDSGSGKPDSGSGATDAGSSGAIPGGTAGGGGCCATTPASSPVGGLGVLAIAAAVGVLRRRRALRAN